MGTTSQRLVLEAKKIGNCLIANECALDSIFQRMLHFRGIANVSLGADQLQLCEEDKGY